MASGKENKTQKTPVDPKAFLAAIDDSAKREDCLAILGMMEEAVGAPARMWGASIIGVGDHHYRYETGREGDWFIVGFSPRAKAITLYLSHGAATHDDLLSKLGPHTLGKGCLYIKRLADVDTVVLRALIRAAVQQANA